MTYVASSRLDARQQQRRAFFRSVRYAALCAGLGRPVARILVSDDDPGIRRLYASLLTAHGFEYFGVPAGDGNTTLTLARRTQPHLLITDVNKPGLSGHALRAALRNEPRTAHIPVLTVTAMEQWSEPQHGLLGPLDDYLLKPFASEALIYRVAALLPLDAAAQDRLVERALRLPCLEHFHPLTGLPCLHTLAHELPERSAQPDWAALSLSLSRFDALTRSLGRASAERLLSRLASLARGAASPNTLVAHPGFDPQIVLIGPAIQIEAAATIILARFDSLSQRVAHELPHAPPLRLRLRRVDAQSGLAIDLPTLRAALRP